MASKNTPTRKRRIPDTAIDHEAPRLAGGAGALPAMQGPEAQLRRVTCACLLWEDLHYIDGQSVADQICTLVPQVAPDRLAELCRELRSEQGLRHVPLLLAREMCRVEDCKPLVADVLGDIIQRPDELTEFVAIYWSTNAGKKSLPAQAKKGLAKAFPKFDAYQLGKWNNTKKEIKLRDVLFLCHAKPRDMRQATTWRQLVDGNLPTPDTWEVAISACRNQDEKTAAWTRLLQERRLGALAFVRNLRNMESAGVAKSVIREGFQNCNPSRLLPVNFITAAKHASAWTRELEDLMFRCCAQYPKLPGHTVFVVDVSGSMISTISARSSSTRMEVAAAMAVLANEMCESASIYATAGDDVACVHQTEKIAPGVDEDGRIRPVRGFALADAAADDNIYRLGGGGIFTRQCCEYLRVEEKERPDRIIIFSDSQDCDHRETRPPRPHGRRNYIIDVNAHTHGVNYAGTWDAEICGWSPAFLSFIAGHEALCNQ